MFTSSFPRIYARKYPQFVSVDPYLHSHGTGGELIKIIFWDKNKAKKKKIVLVEKFILDNIMYNIFGEWSKISG